MKTKPRKSPDKTTLILPLPSNGWSVFRRSGKITEPERLAVQAIQEAHAELEAHSNGFLVEAYRGYKRKHMDEIAMEAAKDSFMRVIHERTQVIEVGSSHMKD